MKYLVLIARRKKWYWNNHRLFYTQSFACI